MSSVVRSITILSVMIVTSPAQAQKDALEAQAVIKKARKHWGIRSRNDCGKTEEDGAIIVCGSRESPYALPLSGERAEGEIKVITGEVPSAVPGTDLRTAHKCSVVGSGYGCTKGLTILKQGF